jgi:hypothetical protein
MTTAVRAPAVATARRVTRELCDALGLPVLAEARPGADLWIRAHRSLPFPSPGALLRAADGWVHPGPPTVWSWFGAMAESLGAPPRPEADALPDISGLAAEAVDAEAGVWRLPAVAVRSTPARAPAIAVPLAVDVTDATVVVLGTAWAVPLVGHVLAQLGARVVRIDNPRRPDPFPLRDALAAGSEQVLVDFDTGAGRAALHAWLARADLLIDGNTPRVLANVGLDDEVLRTQNPALSVVRVSAFAHEDRPGYGFAAECRGGWASRHHPPRLARTSVADPVAGLLAATAAVDLLTRRAGGAHARVTLEDGVGLLHSGEAA